MATDKHRRKTEKRKEYRGFGQLDIRGEGSFGEDINRLVFVEREPDNLMAAALIVKMMRGNFKLIFTDRHSVNFDVTGKLQEVDWAQEVIILCPSINEYSLEYLYSINKSFVYLGNTTKLNVYREKWTDNGSRIYLTEGAVVRKVGEYFNCYRRSVEDIALYTEKLIPEEKDLYSVIRYQYIHFSHKPLEHFKLYYDHLSGEDEDVKLSEDKEQSLRQIYERELIFAEKCIDQIVVKDSKGVRIAFLQGGCPCTLILNVAMRRLKCDLYVNVCMHRQHFTVLSCRRDLLKDYVVPFIYSGSGVYSGGGCFGSDYSFQEFVDAFATHKRIHGFHRERDYDYDVFDPMDHEWVPFKEGEAYLYRNFNFTIFIDDYCNADCRFCIEQIKTENTGRIIKCGKITDVDKYIDRLDKVLEAIRPYNPSVSVTGGEPLISPAFSGVMKLLKKYKFRKTVITTNGTDILKHMGEIIDAGISHVNFSRPHYDEKIVQHIMRFRESMTSFEELKTAIAYLEKNQVRTRFNCIIGKDGIDSVEEMKRYMDYIETLGCNHVVFREMMSFNEKASKNVEKREYFSSNRILMNDLWKVIDADEDFQPFNSVRGHYYYIEMYNYKNISMVSERANLKCLEDERIKNMSYIYEMVFHPNGNLCAEWDENQDILDL